MRKLSDKELIGILENRGYTVIQDKNIDYDRWNDLGFKVNGCEVYQNPKTGKINLECDHMYLRSPDPGERYEITCYIEENCF